MDWEFLDVVWRLCIFSIYCSVSIYERVWNCLAKVQDFTLTIYPIFTYGRGAMDSVMPMATIAEKHTEGVIVGRYAQSAFNTVRREHVHRVLGNRGWLRDWIDDWLAPRRFDVEADGHILGTVTMDWRDSTGQPVVPRVFFLVIHSPALFIVYMSSVVWDAERRLLQRPGGQGATERATRELLAALIHR